MARFYRSWDRTLVLIGPLSWPVAVMGVLGTILLIRSPWIELTAASYAFALLVWLHGLLTAVLIGRVVLSWFRGRRLGSWLRRGLAYYLGMPLITLGMLWLTVGPRGTAGVIRYILRFPLLIGR
ncbi:hypothetical protein [Leptolyngbya sp. KIOST-1]|uniref:hypothetical protein n=1 Tax=Leptolyngbya sp. KIOST-1 TaxID=1229172 RepID=UPI0005685B85|nr:hypothetical protein [Leptolyngbya sp. KIOST-1]